MANELNHAGNAADQEFMVPGRDSSPVNRRRGKYTYVEDHIQSKIVHRPDSSRTNSDTS
jgi:hypothetical protein